MLFTIATQHHAGPGTSNQSGIALIPSLHLSSFLTTTLIWTG